MARETIGSVKSQKKKKWISDATYAAIRAGRCRERRYADHIFNQIYFRMHHLAVKFSKFFRLRRQGDIDPLTKILRTFQATIVPSVPMVTTTLHTEEEIAQLVSRGSKQLHIWNPRPRFAYSLYNFYWATTTIKGRLHSSVSNAKALDCVNYLCVTM